MKSVIDYTTLHMIAIGVIASVVAAFTGIIVAIKIFWPCDHEWDYSSGSNGDAQEQICLKCKKRRVIASEYGTIRPIGKVLYKGTLDQYQRSKYK